MQADSSQAGETQAPNAVIQSVLHDLTIELRKIYGDFAPRILLFGSHARGDAHAESDIDVLRLFPNSIEPLDEIVRVSNLLCDINLDYGELVSTLPASEDQFRFSDGPFWRRVRNEAIEIVLN